MWNRLMSSPYAHFVAAVTLTMGLVLGLLTGYPGKSGVAKSDALAQATQPIPAPGPQFSGPRSGAYLLAEGAFDYSLVFPEAPDIQSGP